MPDLSHRADTWMIYHDHLKIWWEKKPKDYLKSLPCPIPGNLIRTLYDQQIKICGQNNSKVATRYKNCLSRDSPELMLLDCYLFADFLREGAVRNVALTYHIRPNDQDADLKYSFAIPGKVYEPLQQTIAAGCPSTKCIAKDIKRIFSDSLGCIVEAEGCYIEDSSNMIVRNGVQKDTAADH
jgi:hypothetical protein